MTVVFNSALERVMLARGKRPADVAADMKVTERTVLRWLHEGVGPSNAMARQLAAEYGGKWRDYLSEGDDGDE